MKLLSTRLLATVATIDVIALLASGLLRNAHHGPGAVIADMAWFAFLIATVCVITLATAILVSAARRRPAA